jgi:hypothetical protein
VNAKYFIFVKMFEKEMNSPLRGEVNNQLMKNKPNLSSNAIINFFVVKDHVHKYYVYLKLLLEDMGSLIMKIIHPCNL